MSFNPLNQVYVFNLDIITDSIPGFDGFNPLNQVYVFNLRGIIFIMSEP